MKRRHAEMGNLTLNNVTGRYADLLHYGERNLRNAWSDAAEVFLTYYVCINERAYVDWRRATGIVP